MPTNYKKKILLIGSSGYIGNAFLDYLKKDNKIHVNLIYNKKSNSSFYRNRSNTYDISKIDKRFLRMFKKIDLIYFLASSENTYLNDSFQIDNYITNLLLKVINLVMRYNKKTKMIYMSSENAHGNKKNVKDSPLNIYGIEKLFNEKIIEIFSHNYNLNLLSLRLSNIYGFTYNLNNNLKSSLNRIIINLIKNNEINLYKNKNCFRSFTHIDDICKLLIKLIYKKEIYNGNVYYFGNCEKKTINQVISIIKKRYNKEYSNEIKLNMNDKTLSIFEMRNFYLTKKNNLAYILGSIKMKNIKDGITDLISDYKIYYKKQ